MELPTTLLSPRSKKIKTQPEKISSYKIKIFLIFQEIELSGSKIKKSLTFSQKRAFLIFREMKPFYMSVK